MIKNLTLENWNQFKDLNINFHHQVTIITGTNGSGKSTIVRLISNLLGWEYKEIATQLIHLILVLIFQQELLLKNFVM
ncbi:ATP-binding protein [Bacillus sp. A17A.1]